MHIRKFLAATALAVACLMTLSTTVFADDFSAGSLAHPMGVLDIASCDDLAYCGVAAKAVRSVNTLDVASVNALDLPVIMPASLMRSNCSDYPAWMAVAQSDGSYEVERVPACTPRRYDPGWRSS